MTRDRPVTRSVTLHALNFPIVETEHGMNCRVLPTDLRFAIKSDYLAALRAKNAV